MVNLGTKLKLPKTMQERCSQCSYTLLSKILNFEVEKNLWWPYLHVCLQNETPSP